MSKKQKILKHNMTMFNIFLQLVLNKKIPVMKIFIQALRITVCNQAVKKPSVTSLGLSKASLKTN